MEPTVLTRATEKPAASAKRDLRLRAVYRRELQNSIFYAALVVAAGITLSAATNIAGRPSVGPVYFAFSLPVLAASLAVAGIVRRRARRYVVPLGMVVGILPVLTTAISLTLVMSAGALAVATYGLIPIAFAIFIPLDRRPHLAWLLLANLIFFAIVLPTGAIAMNPDHLGAILVAAAIATGLSIGANEVQLRRRHQINDQLLAVRGLYSRMKEHELDLRRQDEFLVMQQETLVVQQAELLRLNEELETIARLDALTGLGNRLRLNEDLAALAARIERHGGTAGILLMDLDRFKRLNDSSGHLAGDAALRGVADVLKKTSRVGDGVYRYGGEEFLVLLHDCDESGLYAAGQRYLTGIQAAGMIHPDNPPYGLVTASGGATELNQSNCTDVDSALHDSDESLYVAKENGRNRLEIHYQHVPADLVPIDQERAAS
jgi:diguanylate cyclase (GGDEF)-like protein